MRIVESSEGPESVRKQNELLESLGRVGTWVALSESLVDQLVRAGRDWHTSTFLGSAPSAAYGMLIRWMQQECGSQGWEDASKKLRAEPAAEHKNGPPLIERAEWSLTVVGDYFLINGADSLSELRQDFDHMWETLDRILAFREEAA